ncbi:cellulose binding domain-containing protein [Amycolatopsis sp. NPDC051716]|uniref:cellulose binding domain-containing protein n=1 Tax=Amycolatopsis sp. NPDC051716 TaxID=3155804 RepID=UPI0034157890
MTPPGRPSCSVHFAIEHSWPNGFTASATITNRGSDTLRSWSLAMTFTAGQRLTEGWNGTWTQRGNRLTALAPSWKTDLQPGEAFTTGFNGSSAASNPAPTGFTVNGAACPAG